MSKAMTYDEGDLVHCPDGDNPDKIYKVTEFWSGVLDPDKVNSDYVWVNDGTSDISFAPEDLAIVCKVDNVKLMEKNAPRVSQEENTVAIVSFEGAVKREVRAIREALKICDVSQFKLRIVAEGRVNDGDVKISYRIGEYSGECEGNSMRETLAEFMRRHGWDSANAPKAISYESIPA